MKYFWYGFLGLVSLGFIGLVVGMAAIIFGLSYYSQNLPDHNQLQNYEPSIVTRIYAGNGQLMAEFSKQKRVFVSINDVPEIVKNAFIAVEDQHFYEHSGLDYKAIARAAITNVKNIGMGRRPEGASTITQQVAKNFLLTNEVKLERKIREAILASRIERALSKDQILELYLNEIYLGSGTYGVAAAALHYFDKSLEELEIHEAAYLAALPKAPNNYHPIRKTKAATARRNLVIHRMMEEGFITQTQADLAKLKPLQVVEKDKEDLVSAPYFAEEIRRELEKEYQVAGLYTGGLAVRSSIDPELQKIAQSSLRNGLVAYDRRHGYRGPFKTLTTMTDWREQLRNIDIPIKIIDEWDLAVVLEVNEEQAKLGFVDKPQGILSLEHAKWAREYLNEGYALGPAINALTQVVEEGDVIIVEALEDEENKYELEQVPDIQGAIIALDPHTGRVLAMQGGWAYSYGASEFNRATQAQRQTGSAFKPFVYLAALEKGFTPATLVLDAPFVIEDRPGNFWKPSNYSNEFYGPTPIRVGIEKSKNLMTVRLADFIGMETIADYAEKFGVIDNMPPNLSMSLGAGETTLLDLTAGYAVFVNGGKKITPTFVDRIQDRNGSTIFRHDSRQCPNCGNRIRWQNQPVPEVPDNREQVADPRTAYQIVSMLEGVIERGTAQRLKSIGYPLAGKTGTTNKSKDAWFIGFSPDLLVGVFTGFDQPRSLGKRETGSSVAAPIFKEFMEHALHDKAPVPFRVPPGIRHVQINAETGARATPSDENKIWEAFVIGTEPTDQIYMLDEQGVNPVDRGFLAEENYDSYYDYQFDENGEFIRGERPVRDYNRNNNSSSANTGTGGIY
ncbi:MAG: penicillin-binding protein 1A [Alphaproteobacteria bacterium]